MYNDILKIGPVTIHGYGLMVAIGIVAALFAGLRLAKKKGLSGDAIYSLTIISVFSGFFCAKILYCIVEWRRFIKSPLSVIGSDGFVIYGGIIGGVFFCGLYCLVKKLSFWKYFDVVLPSVAIAQGFGRIGCFLAGCCYGQETDLPIGVTFPVGSIAPHEYPVLPTQLMSSAGCFIIAAVLFIYARKERPEGIAGALYLIMYSIGRFVIEIFRSDERGSIGPLSTAQFISIFILIIGITILFIKKPKKA